METILIVLSAVLTVGSAVPYMVEIVRGKTKPRIVSWFTWSVLTAIASVASFADGQYPAGMLLVFATVETLLVVILGLRYGDRSLERFDIVCQVGAAVGIVLWLIFNSPEIAVIATVTIDLVGALPTLKHTWQKPHEETWITFAMAGAGALCTLVVAHNWEVTVIAYPAYIVIMNILITTIIFARHKYAVAKAPAELREL